MEAEKQRQRGERNVTVALLHMANRIDPDRSDDDATDEVGLWRKTHLRTRQIEFVAFFRPSGVFDDNHHLRCH